ncbi:MAG: hypothetical protein OEO19_06070 [Gammaproteobacteria bacterium]|nr:hypothetical protein [Gammaproteobacteria bacterium]MDH3449239.1 hypothetical protein [Gammaproteobacteria bacterium]
MLHCNNVHNIGIGRNNVKKFVALQQKKYLNGILLIFQRFCNAARRPGAVPMRGRGSSSAAMYSDPAFVGGNLIAAAVEDYSNAAGLQYPPVLASG